MTINDLNRIIKASSQDETRPYLCSVHILKENDTLFMEATDGHIAIKESVMNESLLIALKNDESILIEKHHIKTLNGFFSSKSLRGFDLAFSRNESFVVIGLGEISLKLKINEQKYPLIETLFKKKKKLPYRIAFNAELLQRLSESMSFDGVKKVKACILEFDLGDPSQAFFVVHGDDPARALIMPMRADALMLEINDSTLKKLRKQKNDK